MITSLRYPMSFWSQTTQTNMRRRATTSLIAVCAMAAAILSASDARASILVGTFVTPQVEMISQLNQLIDDYNSDFGASLTHVQELLDKIEGQNSADFQLGNLELSDFDFPHTIYSKIEVNGQENTE